MKKAFLIILDGFGYSENKELNAIENANTPYIDSLFDKYPNTLIHTSGEHVGLPNGQMGNSEVGHINIGAGRIVYQDSTRISKSINDGDFFENEQLLKAIGYAKNNNRKIHLMGLLSNGGVHSLQSHLVALLKLCKKESFNNVFIHSFMDGRDTAPNSGITFLEELENSINELGIAKIASCSGRYYAMDRDNRWDRIKKAYDAITAKSKNKTQNLKDYIKNSYAHEKFDEFIEPVTICDTEGNALTAIDYGDVIINFNFRADRGKQITRAFTNKEFSEFERDFSDPYYVQFTNYDKAFNLPVAFDAQLLKNTLPIILSENKITQLRCAETEKYAHVTFFLNGGVNEVYDGEDRILVESPKVDTYDLKPEMSAYSVTDKLIESLNSDKYSFIVVNYANSDMVGHTGNYKAAIKAIEVLDDCLSKLIPVAIKKEYEILITADHGNAEKMFDFDANLPFTQHTTGPVPLIYITENKVNLLNNGALKDIAPTVLDILKLDKPEDMSGNSLIV